MAITIKKGSTYRDILRWSSSECRFKAITSISTTAPCILECIGHELVDGWLVEIQSVKGMKEINGYIGRVGVIDDDHFSFDCLNAIDFKPYVSGGVVKYKVPVDMAGYKARMHIKDRIGGDILIDLNTENERIIIDNVFKTITRIIPASVTTAIDWKKAVYDLEMYQDPVAPSEEEYVMRIDNGNVAVEQEVTT